MDKEQIKNAIEVMQAGLDGKTIQCKSRNPQYLDDWRDVTILDRIGFDWIDYDYRIKPEPKVRPYHSKEECFNDMLKHEPFGWLKIKDSDDYTFLASVTKCTEFDFFYKNHTYADGSPFGIVEE